MKNLATSVLQEQEDYQIYNAITLASRNVEVLGEIVKPIDYCPKDYPRSAITAGPASLDNLRWEVDYPEHPQAIKIFHSEYGPLQRYSSQKFR